MDEDDSYKYYPFPNISLEKIGAKDTQYLNYPKNS